MDKLIDRKIDRQKDKQINKYIYNGFGQTKKIDRYTISKINQMNRQKEKRTSSQSQNLAEVDGL